MNPVKALKLYRIYERFEALAKEKEPMQIKLPQLLTLIGTLSAAIGLPALVAGFVHAHFSVYLGIVAASLVLHAVLPSVFGAPSDADKKATGLDKIGLVVLLLLCGASMMRAQAVPVVNLYGAGASYSVNATPAIAGSALYAHQISPDTAPGMYAFTAVDALPNTLKPFTITTNIGAGIAQKVVTFGKVPVFMPTAAGISFNGTNTGWQWNGGVLAAIHIKDHYYVLPTVRFLKSSVSNGSGYQPIFGVLFGWGQ